MPLDHEVFETWRILGSPVFGRLDDRGLEDYAHAAEGRLVSDRWCKEWARYR